LWHFSYEKESFSENLGGIILVFTSDGESKVFLKCFSDVLKGILVFEKLFFSLGNTFGNVFQAIVAFTSFGQENAVLISKSC